MTSREAKILTRYLISAGPDDRDADLYAKAIEALKIPVDKYSEDLWDLVLKNSRLLPYIDAGLKITAPNSPLRQRIYVMLAILETSSKHADFFIYQSDPFWLARMVWIGSRSLFRTAVGICLIKFLSLNHVQTS